MIVPGPAVNTAVTVDVAGWREPLPTRVEELDDSVVVADPLSGEDDHDPSLGTSVRISWQSDRGPSEMPAILAGKELRTVPLWRLQPDGPPVISQRRLHVRVGALLPVVLHSVQETLVGHLVDLSEGGLRAVCRTRASVSIGERLTIRFDVDGQQVVVHGSAVEVDSHVDRTCVRCRFVDLLPHQADVIRRFLFDRQVRERRMRR